MNEKKEKQFMKIVTALDNESVVGKSEKFVKLTKNKETADQGWEFVYDVKKDAYQIKSASDKELVLTWTDEDFIRVNPNESKDEQYWVLEDDNDGCVFIHNKKNYNLVLDVDEANTNEGTRIKVTEKHKDPSLPIKAQKFKLQTSNWSTERSFQAINFFKAWLTDVEKRAFMGFQHYPDEQNQVWNDLYWKENGTNNEGQDKFIFLMYKLDDDRVVIVNRQTGEVLEHVYWDEKETSVVLRPYNGKENQVFRKLNIPEWNTFKLLVDNDKRIVGVQDDKVFSRTKITSLDTEKHKDNDYTRLFLNDNGIKDKKISLPSLFPPGELGPIPELTGFNDLLPENEDAKRVVIGSELIPGILVNDSLTLADRIKKNPYYILEYRQYWHLLWSDVFTAGSKKIKTELTGISEGAQEKMKELIGASICTDIGLKFVDKSEPFGKQITSGLTVLHSCNDELGETTTITDVENPNDFTVKYARYARAHEFVLKDSTGKVVGDPWVAVDENDMYLKMFKK
ncbi:RICIN domain-containing protein [Bacillus cereus]|uniref:RICIN domain-containing protein n=1 Tax=Bacillus cereus TaxID=1396 RepID=UPI0009AAF9B0|nr:RICIN domain-containing protein [Bacillus cereus]PES30627.1 hypothetical protein CN496_08415 [Bacillus cereus]